MNLNILRNGISQAVVSIDERTVLTHKLMGEHKIVAEIVSPAPLNIEIGDYIEHGSEKFYINQLPAVERVNNVTCLYTINFEGEIYYLYNKLFMDEGQADFSYHGTPNDFLLLLLTNINSVQPGWAIGEAEAAAPLTLTFSGDKCRTALTKIAEAFEMEYRLAGKNIYLKKSVGVPTILTFEYGRGKGLYALRRNAIDEKNLVTRVYGFGSRSNLDFDYRDGSTRLVFEERYLENNVGLYGVREGQFTDDTILPSRTGVVTGTDAGDPLKAFDTALDFDINDYLIEGTTAKIVFKTGDLAGYEFEITRYLNASKLIEILPFQEENGYELPNATFRPGIGDEYTIIGISMPQAYVDAAELALKQATQEYLDENSTPRVSYDLELDEKYVRDNAISLEVGHLVQIIDVPLGIDTDIRISEISYPLVMPSRITAVISDTIPYTIEERLIAETVDNNIQVRNVDVRRAELARRATARFRQLQDLVFDPDGYFDGTKIKPNSIETLLLSVGAKSQNFGLAEVTIQANALGNSNRLEISGGKLVHYEIEIEGLGYIWQMSPLTITTLVSGTTYYVYAKCSRTSLTGVWLVSSSPKETEEEAGQYHFYVGILYPVLNGRRDFDFTNGMTFISGDTITTGRIQSLDGLNFFDLTQGKFKVGNATSSLDWNETSANKLTLKGSLIQSPSGDTFPAPVFRGAYAGAQHFQGDVVTHNGSTYIYINPTPNVGAAPPNATYWAIYSEAGSDGAAGADGADGADGAPGADGDDGPGIVFRGNFATGVAYYNNSIRRDVVKQAGVYYIFNGTDGSVPVSFVGGDWSNFGAQFDSVATNLLLAENANIADWLIKSGKISSQQEVGGIPKAQLDGNTGYIKLHNEGKVYNTTGSPTTGVPFDVELDALQGGFRASRGAASDQPSSQVRIRPDHLLITGAQAKGGGDVYLGQRIGIEADVSARQREVLGTEFIAAVYGAANNFEGTNPAPAYGGYFEGISFTGPVVGKVVRVSGTYNVSNDDQDFQIIAVGAATIVLPINPKAGRTLLIKRSTSSTVTVDGNGNTLWWKGGTPSSTENIRSEGMGIWLVFDGIYWQYTEMFQ